MGLGLWTLVGAHSCSSYIPENFLKPMKIHGVVGACGMVQLFFHYVISRCIVLEKLEVRPQIFYYDFYKAIYCFPSYNFQDIECYWSKHFKLF